MIYVTLSLITVNSNLNPIADDVELTKANGPRDKVFEWFIGPLLVMKEQLKNLQLEPNEEISLRHVFMKSRNETPEEWDDTEFPSGDHVRRAQLQAIFRRCAHSFHYINCSSLDCVRYSDHHVINVDHSRAHDRVRACFL